VSTTTEERAQTVSLVVLASIAGAGAMYWLRPVMIPFVLALFISLGLGLAVEFLVTRLRVPRALALPVTVLLGLLAMAGVGGLVNTSVRQLAESAPLYSELLGQLIARAGEALPIDVDRITGGELQALSEIPVATVGSLLARTTNAIVNTLSQSLLVLIFVLFLVLGGRAGARPSGTWGEIVGRVQTYLVGKIVISAITGALVWGTLALLGIPLAMVFGLLAFLLNFIPNVGSLLSTLLPLPVVIVSPEVSQTAAVLAIAVPIAIQMLMGNVIEPMLMGDSLDLHPVAILISLIFWGMLWGIVGMLLATPITAVLKILLEKFDGSRPMAELLAGRVDALLGSAEA
jgi:AI-2 transport protein TqsA